MDDPAVGVALPLYLSMEDTVLEAGSTVGGDGVTVPIGRGCAPDAPEVRFPRVVDFGSAACMVVRTEAFRAVGGFAEAYGLGYYEDTELCFALRERGLRSVYVPGAAVQHGLGASLSKEEAKAR
jgi:GT2 family glycosyltransferase